MHITIAGRLGSGKSTVCAILREKYGYEIYSTGVIMRSIAAELGISMLEMNKLMTEDNKYDHMLDDTVHKISLERADASLVFDSRMAWHFAVNSFRVYMYVDAQTAAMRVLNDKSRGSVEAYKSAEQARAELVARAAEENYRYKMIYGVDNLDYNNYDLVIDTGCMTPDEIATLIIEEYKLFCADKEGFNAPRMYLSAAALFPNKTAEEMQADGADGEVGVVCVDGFNYAVTNTAGYLAAIRRGEKVVPCKPCEYPAETAVAEARRAQESYSELEALGGFKFAAKI